MARRAVLAGATSVDVGKCMTAQTVTRRALERLRGVTLRAGWQYVQAQQRVVSQVVVKADTLAPLGGAMALVAGRPELAGMRVHLPVAVRAGLARRLPLDVCGVAGMAAQGSVPGIEGDAGACRVIVGLYLPAVVAVALAAVEAEPTGVRVVGAVTTLAVTRKVVLEAATLVAGSAGDHHVPPEQRESGLGVVEA